MCCLASVTVLGKPNMTNIMSQFCWYVVTFQRQTEHCAANERLWVQMENLMGVKIKQKKKIIIIDELK